MYHHKKFFHWGPLIATFIISSLSFICIYIDIYIYPPFESFFNLLSLLALVTYAFLVLSNYFSCIFVGPGFVEIKWNSNKSLNHILQWCQICQGYKPPRAHHCRKCNRCVKKMDHHCPWINTCCGQYNQNYFIYFLFFAILGCIHASVLLMVALMKIINQPYGLYIFKTFHFNLFVIHLFAIGLSIGVVIFVSLLFYFQIKNLLKNQTSIEDYIIQKVNQQKHRDYVFTNPYDLGWGNNIKQTLGSTRLKMTELDWPVKEGFTLYSLSMEQIKLKEIKKLTSVTYIVTKNYNGNIFPVYFGIMTFLYIPCSDEPRITLNTGNFVKVTRWKKYWLYGEKIYDSEIKGWFPRECVQIYKTL